MEDRAVVMPVGRVLAKILAGDRRLVVEEFDADVAVVGLDRDHGVSLYLALVTRGKPE